MAGKQAKKCVLGLDLGANSVGWALVEFRGKEPCGIVAAGSRLFEAGVDGQMETGREESRTVERREARQRRRQLDRQSRRMGGVCQALQQGGLLPKCNPWSGAERHTVLHKLDRTIYTRHAANADEGDGLAQLPYYLRARALDEKLEPHELGRALYHLAQRRGFLSNRKTGGDDEESGTVKPAIAQLAIDMIEANARTLGEYLSRVDPVMEQRLRSRWTARKMYEHEFEAIWAAQSEHHSKQLTDTLKKDVYKSIFDQRPLKSQKGLIGKCDFEKTESRAPWALLPAQSFRLMQRVNDLVIHFFDGKSRPLTADERTKLAEALEREKKMTFAGVRKLLNIKKCELNLERGGEKNIVGNHTAASLRDAIGDRWDDLDYDRQQALVGEVMGIDSEETMIRRGLEAWGLDEDAAKRLAAVRLQNGFCSLSKKAIKKILPLMEDGTQYATACQNAYDQEWVKVAIPFVPTVEDSVVNLRNPAVMRVLTELRKVVNAIIREHGKPDEIHVELARDLKKPPKARQEIWKRNRAQEKERDRLRKMLEGKGIPNPSRADIEKALLWEECNHECPYTGKSISWGALFGEASQYDVEHIVPFSRCLDNSFLNKTLCYHEENRNRKRNQTPYEAYSEEELAAIVERVKRFGGDAKKRKLELFLMEEVITDDFISRQLNDTRYASKEAKKFLGYLYGEEALSRVQATGGQATGYLRWAWKLNGILGDGDKKTRDDHRHHALDAVVIALTDRATVKRLSVAAKQQLDEKGRSRGWWNHVEYPWNTFLEDVQQAIDGITVSHRVSRKVAGRLHEDTNYTAPREDEDGKEYVAIRKPLGELFKQKDIDNIVDPAVRAVVQDWYDEHAGDSKAAFADPANHPRLSNGRPIHRVRIKKKDAVFPIGKGDRTRYVTNDTNHHVEIIEFEDKKGRTKWDGIVVSRYEATQRLRNHQPVIQRDHGEGKRFVFSLGLGECVRMKDDEGEWGLYRVIGVSQFTSGQLVIDFQRVTDARLISKIDRKGRTRSAETLRKSEATKVSIGLLGEIRIAND